MPGSPSSSGTSPAPILLLLLGAFLLCLFELVLFVDFGVDAAVAVLGWVLLVFGCGPWSPPSVVRSAVAAEVGRAA